LDLLKGSIDYFRHKCDKARNNGFIDNDAQKTYSFLEGILEKIEQKFKGSVYSSFYLKNSKYIAFNRFFSNLDLIEKKDEIDVEIKDMFDTPDMKKVVYRLKAVLGFDGHHHYAYVWVSKGNKTETVSNNYENGNWWKFSDMNVEEVRLFYMLQNENKYTY
jgi:hypothetical protein